jgi:NTP pyrophosphatase (non-canonical NTP hydrolase)
MLVVSELSEAVEEYRNRKPVYYVVNGKPEGIIVELADAVIRIADIAEILRFDLEDAILAKMDYNDKRPYRHGEKRV